MLLEAPIPSDEAQRISTLKGLNILDSSPEERFDRITRIAKHLFNVPITLVSLVDTNRQWFKSCQGLDASETPRNISFCGHAILRDEALVIADALLDARFADNPLVTGAPNIRFYAGQPLHARNGMRMGTLCVIDITPRNLSLTDLDSLQDLAAMVEDELDVLDIHAANIALHQSEKKLSTTNQLHQAILNSAEYLIISTTTDGTIQTFNRAAERALGYSAEQLIGKSSPAIFHDLNEIQQRAQELQAAGINVEPGFEVFVALAKRGEADWHKWTYIRKDGSRFPVMLAITALLDERGVVTGFLGVATDITDRLRIERMKTEFISTVSHELRTPLTSIRGALGLIAGGMAGELPAQAKTLLDIAHKNSERLILLVNDILDMEKIESGKMNFNMQEVELFPLLQQALEANRAYGEQFNVSFILEQTNDIPPILIDTDRFMQVLANFLSNAAKFSPAGSIVSVAAHTQDQYVRVNVTDRGQGIPEEFHKKIFQKFSQADSSDTRVKGGTGLGLSISKAIVEGMGGQIGFCSESGKGATFFATFPSRK